MQDPTFGVRLLNLPSRIQTVSLTMTTTGAVMMALAWLMLGRFALGSRRMSRGSVPRLNKAIAVEPMASMQVIQKIMDCVLSVRPMIRTRTEDSE